MEQHLTLELFSRCIQCLLLFFYMPIDKYLKIISYYDYFQLQKPEEGIFFKLIIRQE